MTDLRIDNGTAVLRLDNGITNPIHPEGIAELAMHLKTIQKQATALIVVGNDKFFSIGFDLPRVMTLDRRGLTDFLYDFQNLLLSMTCLPIPTIAALTGHAVAGGAILALGCDVRIARSDKIRIGFNESLLGLTIPWMAELLLTDITGPRACRRLMTEGLLLDASAAVDIGLADEHLPGPAVMERAEQKARQLANIPAPAFAAVKENLLGPIRDAYQSGVAARTEQFVDLWFLPDTQKRLTRALEKF